MATIDDTMNEIEDTMGKLNRLHGVVQKHIEATSVEGYNELKTDYEQAIKKLEKVYDLHEEIYNVVNKQTRAPLMTYMILDLLKSFNHQ